MEILFLLAGLCLGFVVSFLILKSGKLKQIAVFEREKQISDQLFLQQKFEVEKEKSLFEDRNQSLLKEKDELLLQVQQLRIENGIQAQQQARAEADFGNLQEKLDFAKEGNGKPSAKIYLRIRKYCGQNPETKYS